MEESVSDDLLSFKEMCEKFEVTPRTLRYYEYIELLSPRREGRSRFYTARDQVRMSLILRGRRFGFSLEQIRQWLSMYDEEGQTFQMQRLLTASDKQLAVLREQQTELEQTIAELEEVRGQVVAFLDNDAT